MIIIFNPVTATQKLKQNAFGKYIFGLGIVLTPLKQKRFKKITYSELLD